MKLGMKKILVCVQEYPPYGSGIGNVAYNVVEQLKNKNYECDVIHPENINFKNKYIKKFAGIGLILFWEKVRKHILKNHKKYDIIWVHNPLFLKKIKLNKIYSTVHTTYTSRLNYLKQYNLFVKTYYYIMKLLEERCYNENKFKTNVISKSTTKELKKLGVNPIYIPNGVDTKQFTGKGRYKYNFEKEIIYGLCVGRIAYQKNPYNLIKYIEKLNENIKVKLLWVGTGELYKEMQEFIKKENIKHTELIGRIPYNEISNIYGSVDFFVLGSVYEGQPLVLLEAMSSGLPCVVSDLENIKEIVEDSNCGFVIDFNKPELLADYLKSKKFKEDGTRAKKYALKNLDWSIIADKYIRWFEK